LKLALGADVVVALRKTKSVSHSSFLRSSAREFA
jgi:hypothetical protein